VLRVEMGKGRLKQLCLGIWLIKRSHSPFYLRLLYTGRSRSVCINSHPLAP
jgi:hypothetical protein